MDMLSTMRPVTFRGRRGYEWETSELRVTILAEGGHIAEIFHKKKGINPLWEPPWKTIEPSTYSPEKHPEFGRGPEAKLLSGIAGHNWCVDFFGPPSEEEARAGYSVHGEASVVAYDENLRAHLPLSQLNVQREMQLDGNRIEFTDTVENLLPFDRQVAWQEHVTLGPPFVERGVTEIDAPVLRSAKLNEGEFEWKDRKYPNSLSSSEIYTNLLTKGDVKVTNRNLGLRIAYEWNLQDFPWLAIWEENHGRTHAPWNGRTMSWGIEFGASPFPEYRFRRATRGLMWGAPTAVWLPAKAKRSIRYTMTLDVTR
ncbi:MAG: DUF4432 family protein [Acidobacteria bacterium]|nr:DUF4432 family protein [Acidobacteriota bacterium]